MKERLTYNDSVTGYTITQYTKGDTQNAKRYFTTENFTEDDKIFISPVSFQRVKGG